MNGLWLKVCLWMIFTFYLFIGSGKSITNMTAEIQDPVEIRLADLENAVRILEQKVQLLKNTEQKDKEPVMFYATTFSPTHSFFLDTKSTVVFERVVMNMGGHYNKFDGIFVAPKAGIYLFAWSVCTSGNAYVMTELMVEDTSVSRAGVHGNDSYYCGSMTALYRMEKEYHAWIRTTSHGSKNFFYTFNTGPQSSFLGVIIHA